MFLLHDPLERSHGKHNILQWQASLLHTPVDTEGASGDQNGDIQAASVAVQQRAAPGVTGQLRDGSQKDCVSGALAESHSSPEVAASALGDLVVEVVPAGHSVVL
ncbi:hypothetical protein H920_00439 [Fukomys damarensis]|uniref:Uncharacterized protein n=1 Tax=Fukomys damarensis TaxID=885580 RepID=A0A091E0Y4_FUKDA|nr:hypothetical protein H920_00439 [Fukomys damarensis]